MTNFIITWHNFKYQETRTLITSIIQYGIWLLLIFNSEYLCYIHTRWLVWNKMYLTYRQRFTVDQSMTLSNRPFSFLRLLQWWSVRRPIRREFHQFGHFFYHCNIRIYSLLIYFIQIHIISNKLNLNLNPSL